MSVLFWWVSVCYLWVEVYWFGVGLGFSVLMRGIVFWFGGCGFRCGFADSVVWDFGGLDLFVHFLVSVVVVVYLL